MLWFTSDLHFYHTNIIKYSNRPFESVEDMNAQLIANWNRSVLPNDQIYHLGDFAFCSYESIKETFKKLNGTIHLILGNHDKHIKKNQVDLLQSGLVASIQDYAEVKFNNRDFMLFHFPMRSWHKKHYGSIHCFGHVHGTMLPLERSLDVGVDSKVITPDYRPVSALEIIKWAEHKPSP